MTDKQQQAFEAWADDRKLSTQTNPRYGGYILADTARAWEAWTASRKLALEEAAQRNLLEQAVIRAAQAWGDTETDDALASLAADLALSNALSELDSGQEDLE